MAEFVRAYLDNSATTRACDEAIDKINEVLREDYFNPSAVYLPAVNVMRGIRDARDEIATAVHGKGATVMFTSGGTESNNLAILGTSEMLRGEKKLALSSVEHPSVKVPYAYLEENGGSVFDIPVLPDGEFDLEALRKEAQKGLSLVSVMQVNNETGAISPIKEIREAIGKDTLLHVDGVQGFLRVPFEMKYADMYSISGHKVHAPKGIGALVCTPRVRLHARQMGGGQEKDLRSGTENTPGILAFAEAVKAFRKDADACPRMMERKMHLVEGIFERVPGALINGPDPRAAAPHIVNISFPGMRGEVMLHALEEKGVLVSTGAACSAKKKNPSATLIAMGISRERADSAIRFSLSRFTTEEEIDYAVRAIGDIYEKLNHYRRT